MSRRRVVYFSGFSGGEKVKLLGTHDKKPWVVFYSEHDHTLTLVDFSTRTFLARQTLQAIVQAAPVSPSSLPQSQTPEMRLKQQRRRHFEQQHRAVVDILFLDGNLDNKKASPAPSSHTSHSPEDTVALMLELGEVRHLSFTDCAAWQRQGTISSLHSGNFILIQTTNYVIFYDFFVHSTLFLSNLGAVVFRGIKYLGVAAGGRYRSGPGQTFATTPQGAHSSRSSFSSSTPTPSSQQEGSLGFNPTCCSFVDAGVLAIGCSDGSIRIWRLLNDLHRCKETTRWLAYRCEVACMHCLTSVPGFTRAKAWLVTVGADGVGYAWCANIPQTAVPAGMGMGFGGADLAWHTLDGTFTTLAAMAADARDSTNRDSLTAISNANSAIVAPIARFLAPSAPKTGSKPTYAAASATLSIVLADLSVYAVSMGPLFGVGAGGMGGMGVMAGVGAGEGGTGRGRSSSSNSSDGGRSSFSSLSSTPAAAHAGAHPANKAPGKRSGILGGVSSLSLTKSLFSFVGKAESGSTSGGAVLFAAEEQSAVWAPLDLGGLAVHSKNKTKTRHCVCALVGSRGEVMAATKASSVLLVCVGGGGGGGGGGGSGGTATASSSAPASLTSLATHASDAREDTLLVRDEWNIQSAVSSFLGVDAQEDTEAGAGAGHAGAEKSIKLYALARACGPFVVLGTNRGIVVVLYHSALTPALRLVSHSSWNFALVAGGGASSSSRRVSKLTHSPQSSSSSSSSGGGGGGGDDIAELSTTVQEQLDVLPGAGLAAADDGWTATVAPLQLIPSVSGKYFCLLFPTPTTRPAAGGLSGSGDTTARADAPPATLSPSSVSALSSTTYTYVILAHSPLQEVERGSCCSFAWVGARDQYILTTVTAEPQPLPTASSTPPAASKRVSILNSMKGLLRGGKASKGEEVLRRKCVVKKAVSAAPRASPGVAQEAVVVNFSSTPQPLRAGGSGGFGDAVVAFSGPVVYLTASAAVATVSRGAGGGGSYGAFYHFSSGSGSGSGGGGEGGGDAVAILSPISPSMPTPLDVQWTPCAGSRPGTTRALGACLFSSGSILIVGLGVVGAESNTVSSGSPAVSFSASTSSSSSGGLTLSCLFVVPFASPTSPLGFAPSIIWASGCGGNEARTVDMLHISTPAGSYMVAIPKQHGPACVLISNLLPLPKPDFGGEAIPTYLSPQGMLVYLTTPAFGVRISAQPTAALMACLHCGRQEEAEYWAALSRG